MHYWYLLCATLAPNLPYHKDRPDVELQTHYIYLLSECVFCKLLEAKKWNIIYFIIAIDGQLFILKVEPE
jgi:hypothetical protein